MASCHCGDPPDVSVLSRYKGLRETEAKKLTKIMGEAREFVEVANNPDIRFVRTDSFDLHEYFPRSIVFGEVRSERLKRERITRIAKPKPDERGVEQAVPH